MPPYKRAKSKDFLKVGIVSIINPINAKKTKKTVLFVNFSLSIKGANRKAIRKGAILWLNTALATEPDLSAVKKKPLFSPTPNPTRSIRRVVFEGYLINIKNFLLINKFIKRNNMPKNAPMP